VESVERGMGPSTSSKVNSLFIWFDREEVRERRWMAENLLS